MIKSFSRFTLFGLVAMGMIGNAAAQSQTELADGPFSFLQVLKACSGGLSDDQIQEIVQLRRRLGGGTGLESMTPFQRLQSVGNLTNHNDRPICQNWMETGRDLEVINVYPEMSSSSQRLFLEMLTDNNRPNQPAYNDSNETSDLRVEEWRIIAAELEKLAAKMEEMDLFEDADLLRHRARYLWQSARDAVRTSRFVPTSNPMETWAR